MAAVVAKISDRAVKEDVVPAQVTRAERSMWRAVAIGIAGGVPICAAVWIGLVALALAIADAGWSYGPALAMAAVVGAFAGVFFGSWVGVTLTAERLEAAEKRAHDRR